MLSETCRRPSFSFSIRAEHGVERFRQPVEFVAGAAHRQALREIARHDLRARVRHAVDALQRVAADREPDDQRTDAHDAERHHQRLPHQQPKFLRLAEIAADQNAQAVVEHEHMRQRHMAFLAAFVGIALIAEGLACPAFLVEHARLQRGDIAGQDLAVRPGDHVEIGARLARPPLQRSQQSVDAAAAVDLLDLRHFRRHRILRLLFQQPLRTWP